MAENLALSVSVIVVNWNRKDLLRSCLDSLRRQEDILFEVIVVDNGSTDGSVELVASEVIPSANHPVRLIRNETNTGFCKANNQGIAAARAPFVALLNNDAEADPRWLVSLWGELAPREDFGMAASKIVVWEDPRRIDKTGHLIYLDGQNRGRGSGEFDRGQYDHLEEVLWPDGCAAMYRKEMLDRIGGFDEDLFAYGDDAELGLRARIAGWGCIYVPFAIVRHHRAATLGVLSPRRLELIERNRLLLAVKHFPLSLLLLNGFYYSARLCAGAWASIHGRGEAGRYQGWRGTLCIAKSLLRGNLQGLRMIPATVRKRRAFKPIRKLTPRQVRRLLMYYRISLKTLSEQSI